MPTPPTAHALRTGDHVAQTVAPPPAPLGHPNAIVLHGQTQLVSLEIEADFDPEEQATDDRRQVRFDASLRHHA